MCTCWTACFQGQPARHQEVCAGPSWSSYALQVRSLLLHGFRLNPLFDVSCETICCTNTGPQGRARGESRCTCVQTAPNNEPNSFLRDWPSTCHLAFTYMLRSYFDLYRQCCNTWHDIVAYVVQLCRGLAQLFLVNMHMLRQQMVCELFPCACGGAVSSVASCSDRFHSTVTLGPGFRALPILL
jgi:hypothetical protein